MMIYRSGVDDEKHEGGGDVDGIASVAQKSGKQVQDLLGVRKGIIDGGRAMREQSKLSRSRLQ